MTVPTYTAEDVARALSWSDAVAALRWTLASGLDLEAEPPRSAFPFGSGEMLAMPSSASRFSGVKLVTIAPGNPGRGLPRIHGTYLLFDTVTLAPLATLDGAALTSLRTPAVSALGVDLVAPETARRLVVFGSGPQARGHVYALRTVRPVEDVQVVGRNPVRVQALVDELRGEGLSASVGEAASVADADLIACCTTAREPLFDGRLLADSAVVVAVGSHEPDAREVDSETVRRCGALVEARIVATSEAGDIRLALGEGAMRPDELVTLAELVRGNSASRPRLIKTVGMGWEDLAVAAAVVDALGPPRQGVEC